MPSMGETVACSSRILAVVALLVTLWPGAVAGAPARTEVRMWTLLSGGDGERMRALVDGFNASQAGAHVVTTTLTWGEPFYTKLMTASKVGAGPDLVTVHLSRLANLVGAETLRPLSKAELAAAGIEPGDFYPRLMAKSAWRGTVYAVPLDTHALVLYYNKNLLGKAGLLDAGGALKPIEGMAAFTDALRLVKERTGAQGLTMECSPNAVTPWRLWLSLLAQRGATIIEGRHFAYGKAGEETLAAMSSWFANGYASRGLDYPASTSQFMSGKAGFMINGVWEVPALVSAAASSSSSPNAFAYGVAPLPRLYDNASVWGDSHAFALPANAGQPMPPVKVAAALQFVAYVSRHSLSWAKGGHIPANQAVAESPAAQALAPNNAYAASVARNVVYDPDGWYAGAAGPLQTSSSKFLPAALSGQLTPARALSLFEAEAGKLLVRSQPKP
jgi:multiple sugar transport system substrate-binding protein